MRCFLVCLAALALTLAPSSRADAVPVDSRATSRYLVHLNLGGAWQLAQSGSSETISATVPGCVHTDLLTAKKIPDPFYRNNQTTLQWISDRTWTYTRHFEVSAALLAHRDLLLRCEGLETVAAIAINGQPVAKTDNMFRTYVFDIKPMLKVGNNSIEVVLSPIGPYIRNFIKNARGLSSSARGQANIRQAPYGGGWDFGPEFIPCGIYKKIELLAFDQARLTHTVAHSNLNSDGNVTLDVDAFTQNPGNDTPLIADVTLSLNGASVVHQSIPVFHSTCHCQLAVPSPQLWWPNGMGAHPLYDLVVDLKDAQGNLIDQQRTRVGLRKIVLLPKTEQRPLRLAVNGRELFAKGTDWIPCDMFATRVTAEKLHQYIADAAAVNMNMIRCWGGGYYEEDAFYDACDEMGILVWSEFKFACAVYPSGNPAFVENVRQEVIDQVTRLQNHPSIAVWCGNNEVMSLITGYKILKKEDYNYFFHDIIGAQVKALMPDANYVGGSPEAGDEHNWWVWHVGQNFEKYLESHGWMTEFGFQSFPCPATVESYTVPADRTSVLTPVMRAHQHNGNGRGNEMIVDMMGRYFKQPKDFDSSLWLSQINQAYGVTMGIEHWRSDWPASSGSLVWQYDDCWPGPTWSSIDYYGRWKALHYKLREAFAPLMVTARYMSGPGEVQVAICSDVHAVTDARLDWQLTDTDGNSILKGSSPITIPEGTCSINGPGLKLSDAIGSVGRNRGLLWLTLSADGKIASQKVIWFVRPKDIDLADPQIKTTVATDSDGFDVTVTAAHPALWAWLDVAGDADARYSDNFIHLLPGRPVHVHVTPSRNEALDKFTANLRTRSLFDTFESTAVIADHTAELNSDGSIIAIAEKAQIVGESARLEAGNPSNIGGWSDAEDELEWRMPTRRPGAYHVILSAACPAGAEGSEIEVASGSAHVSGLVPATNGWEDYKSFDLGIMTLTGSGQPELQLRALRMPHMNVMNLRSITLRPVN